MIAQEKKKFGGSIDEVSTPTAASTTNRFSPIQPRFLAFVFFIAGLVGAFAIPLASLAIGAAGSDLDSYILLVPLVSAYLIYLRWRSLPNEYSFSPIWAMISVAAGFFALLAAWDPGVFGRAWSQHDYLMLMALSFVCFLLAGGFLFLGRKWMAAATFPFAFLFLMVPLPDRAADFLETVSKLASAEAANLFFNMSGTPVLRDGVVFQLPAITIQVAQECSGIRSSLVLFITSLVAANLFLKNPWRRTVLVAAVIPLGIVRNGLRILFIGLLCTHIGPEMIHSIFHRRGGPPFFILSLVPLFLLLWWLRRGEVGRALGAKGDI